MNSERPNDPREQMEVRITALLLGEASAFEEAELLEAIKNDPELETYYEEMRGLIGTVQETIQSAPAEDTVEEKEQIKLDEKRRVKLLKLLKARKEETIQLNAVPWWKRTIIPLPRFLEIAAVFAILAVLAGLFLPSLSTSKRGASDLALLPAVRQENSVKQSVYESFAKSAPSSSQPKNIPTDSDITRFRRSGSIDPLESEDPWRGEIVNTSGQAITEAESAQQTARIFLPKQTTIDDITVQTSRQSESSRFGKGFEAQGVSDSGLADKQRPLQAVQLGRNLAEQNVYFSGDIEASAEVTDTESSRPPARTATRRYRVSEGVPPKPSHPENRGRFAGTEVMLGEQIVRETEPRGGRVSNVETAGRRQARLARSQELSGDIAFGEALQSGGIGGGGGGESDFGADLSPPTAAPESASISVSGIAQSDGLASLDSSAFSDISEPINDQTVVSSIAPIEDYDVDFDGGTIQNFDGRGADEIADKKSINAFTIPAPLSSIPGQASPTEGIPSWHMQTSNDRRAIWDEMENSLGLERQSAGQVVSEGEQKARPAVSPGKRSFPANSMPASSPRASTKTTPGGAPDRATLPNQDTSVQADQVELGFAMSAPFGDQHPAPSDQSSFGIASTSGPASGVIRDEEKNVNELYRGVTPQHDATYEQLLTQSSPQPPIRSLARNDAGSQTLDRGETGRGQELTRFEREAIVDLNKSERDFVAVEEQVDSNSASDIQIDSRFVEIDSKNNEPLALFAKETTDLSAKIPSANRLTMSASAEPPAMLNDTVKKKAEPVRSAPLPPDLEPRPEVQTSENAFSTFSLNVSDVSFKLAKASLENGQLPDGKKLRSEEFINAMDYHDPAPLPGQKLAFHWERARYPFAFGRDLLRFSIQTAAAGRQADQPLNLVVLLDNSGSMERSDRVEITRQMLAVLANQLHPNDRISVISFARTARLWVDGMPGGDPAELLRRVGRLNPEGGTNLEEALRSGYEIAQKHYNNYANNRVILLTDGAANLGNVDPGSLQAKVVEQRQRGIALDCFGVGWEGYNDSLLETLSRNGDGRYGFINQPEDAESEFADLLAGALQVSASDVKAQVEFNPDRVTSYRQIGYLQHQLTKEQFRDNTVDAAEIGAAEAGNALYVTQIDENGTGPIGTVRVRYRIPATGLYEEREWVLAYNPVSAALERSSPSMKLAATAASFAEWLAQSPHAAEVTLGELQTLMNGVPQLFAPDSRPQALQRMIRSTRSISGQ